MFNPLYEFAQQAAFQFTNDNMNQFVNNVPNQNVDQAINPGKAPPASVRVLQNLPVVKVTSDDLLEETNKECLICLEEQKIGSMACKLACGHLYHRACLTDWLKRHCTCPVCRFELETDDYEYEKERKNRMLKHKMRFRLDELKSKKVSQLRDIASCLSVSMVGCIDKGEVIEKLLASGKIQLIECAPAIRKTRQEFESMGVGELRNFLLSFGLSSQGVLEKSELRSRLLNSGRIIIWDDEVCGSSSNGGDVNGSSAPSNESTGYGNAARSNDIRIPYEFSFRENDDQLDVPVPKKIYSSSSSAESAIKTDNSGFPNENKKRTNSSASIKEEEVRAMSVSELRKLSGQLFISIDKCLYKEDIIDRLLASGNIIYSQG
jgi:hypothetical protein